MSEALRAITSLAAALIGLALVAVILSTRSNSANVIGSAGNALSSVIGAATSPISGAQVATQVQNVATPNANNAFTT
jgi:hypothetical protein